MNDLPGLLIGLLRRLTFTGTGQPRFTETGQRVRETAQLYRDIPEQLGSLIEHHPRHSAALSMRADVELEAGDVEAALRTAALLRARFPGLIVGYVHGCAALRRLQRHAEAEAMARAAIRRFPRAANAYEAFAYCAQDRGDWQEAFKRWRTTARRFPGGLWPNVMHASCLARLGRMDDAEAVIARTVQTWPEEWLPSFHAAEIAETAGDWPTASARWLALRKRFPGRPEAYIRGTRALRQIGELDQAGSLIASGIFIFPRDPAMRAERAAVLAAGGDPGPEPEG
jgi:predicted Zn-dependent protease